MLKRAQAIGFPPWAGSIGLAIAVAITYFLAARLSLALLTEPDGVAVFWPAAGIASGIMIALGRDARLPVAVGVMAATVAANLLGDRNVGSAIVFALCNAGEGMIIAWLIEHHFGSGFSLDSSRRVLGLFLATGVGTAVSGLGGTAGFILFHGSDAPFLSTWLNWFASDAIGVVTVAPMVIGLARTLHDLPGKSELVHGTLALVVLALLSAISLGAPADYWFTILPLSLLFPLLLWPAAHCRPVFAAAAAFILALAIVWTITFGIGRLGDPGIRLVDRVHAAEAGLLAISACALVLAALFAERRRNEAALKDSNHRLQLALDCAELGIWSLHLKTDRFENDVRDRRIHGHGTEAPPQTLAQMRSQVHPDDLSNLDTAFAALGRAGGSCKTEYRLRPRTDQERSGRERWVAIEGTVVRRADGRPVQLLGVTRDITERKRAAQALAERDAQLAIAGKIALMGSFAFDIGSGKMQVSPGYAAIHDLPEGTVETRRADWRARVHRDDLPRLDANLQRDIDGRRSEHYCEYRIIRPGGEIRWIEARSFIAYDREGAAQRIAGANIDVTKRKKAELALAERTLQLALAEKTALVGSLAYDVDADKMQISEGYAAIHGFPDGTTEIMRGEWQTGVHPEDVPRLQELRNRAFREQVDEYGADYRIVRPGGDIRWIEARSFVSYRGDGSPQRVVGVNIDVTERKHAEARLQESERESRELLGALPAAIYVTDAAGHLTYFNQSAVDLWGVTPNLGQDRWCNLARFYHADGTPMALEDCPTEIALKRGRVVRGREAIIERSDGTRIPIVPYPTPLRDARGTIVGVVNMTVDIGERKKAEQSLAERNVQLALAARAALVGSYVYDVSKGITQASQGYATIHGLPEGTTETTISEWRARVHPEDLARAEGLREQAFADRRKEDNAEYRIVLSNGEVRWIERRGTILYGDDGRPERVIGVNIDVTERKRGEEHQRALVAELDHRVKNVLATVSAVAAQTLETSSSMSHFVAALDGRIRSMASAHELLSTRQWMGMSMAELVRREFAAYAGSNNSKLDGPDVMLSAEAGQAMGMVIHELVTNAAKYGALSDQSGRVSVRWYRKLNGGAQLVLVWQETGGPRVEAPKKSGYGTGVIRDLIPYEFGGTVDLAFAPDGVRCRLEIPSDRISSDSRDASRSERLHHAERSSSARPS